MPDPASATACQSARSASTQRPAAMDAHTRRNDRRVTSCRPPSSTPPHREISSSHRSRDRTDPVGLASSGGTPERSRA